MFAAELLLLAYVGAHLAPDSVLGRWLIREPARALASWSGRKLALAGTILFVTLVVVAPELAVLVGLADLSLLADFGAIALVLGAAGGWKTVKATLWRFTRASGRLGSPKWVAPLRRIGRRLLRPPRSDEVDDAEWAFA